MSESEAMKAKEASESEAMNVKGKELSWIDVLLLMLKGSIEEGKILFTREEAREYIIKQLGLDENELSDEDLEALDELLDEFVVYADDNDSDYDILAVMPKDLPEAATDTIDELLDLYKSDAINIDLDTISGIALALIHKYESECLESGDPLAFYVYKALETHNIKPIEVENEEECYEAPYTCDITLRYPYNITLVKSIEYCNECLNGGGGSFIEKCTYIKFPERA